MVRHRPIIFLLFAFTACTWADRAFAEEPSHPATAPSAAQHEPSLQHVSPDLHEILQIPEHGRTYAIMMVLFQVAIVLIAAKLCGSFAEQVHVPGVIGELAAGVVIGPYLLGHMIRLPLDGAWVPLFPAPAPGQWPVNDVLWSFAQFASIVLLFMAGLQTDLKQFLRYVGPAALVAIAGVVVPFGLGVAVVYIPYFADLARAGNLPVLVPALYVGAILAATSVGITARVLGDMGKLDTPEGVAILGAAVVDDVLGIIALAIVGNMASLIMRGGDLASLSFASALGIAGKAFGVWIGLTLLVLVLARPIERLLGSVKYAGATVALGLALAFICSGVTEFFGLAFIIGAYSVGLGLSQTKLARTLMDELTPIGSFFIPLFFAALGMLVNLRAMCSSWGVVAFGLSITAVAIIGKLIGCGVASLPAGFNLRGAYRIGVGMMPRGEVALIVAGIALSRQMIGDAVFGVSIMMTLLTTVIAPIFLVPAFVKGGSGRRRPRQPEPKLPSAAQLPGLAIRVPPDLGEVLLDRLVKTAERHGWAAAYDSSDENIHLLRSRGDAAQLRLDDGTIRIDASDTRQPEFAGFLEDVRKTMADEASALVATMPRPSLSTADAVPGTSDKSQP